MADLSINVVAVMAPSGAIPQTLLATVNFNHGDVIYAINSTHAGLANAAVNINTAAARGIAVGNGYTGQPIPYVDAGTITIGATVPVGHILVLSPNAGKIGNHADLTTNHYLTPLGYGNNSTTIELAIYPTGIQRA